jgi:hypothetical protein
MKPIFCKILEGSRFVFEIILPKGKTQKRLFSVLFLLYAVFSVLMFYRTNFEFPDDLMDYDIHGWSHIYGQKKSLLLTFCSFRHPLIILILYPVVFVNCIIQLFASGELAFHVLFLRFVYNILSALSVVVVYKYCSHFLKLSTFRALLICILFSMFAHVLLLSFNPDTFPLSMFGLLVLIYMTTDSILNNQKIPLASNVILFCFITGTTISSGLKVLFAQLFQKDSLKNKCKTFILSGSVCTGWILFSFITTCILGKFVFSDWSLDDNTADYIAPFSSITFMSLFHDFFFEPLLFHHNYDFWNWAWIGVLKYNTIFPLVASGILYVIVLIALIINIKQRPVLLLLSFFLSDMLIHIVFGYGIYGSYIFALHWLFIVPLLIGWLYYRLKSKHLKIGLDLIIIGLAVFCAINNFARLGDLFFPTAV